MSDMSSTSQLTNIQVTLKWSKQTYQLSLNRDESALAFKESVHALTGVPIHRQKLLAKSKGGGDSCWKGPLKDNYPMNTLQPSLGSPLVVTLIGSAETIPDGPKIKTTFVEDMTPEQIRAAEDEQIQEAMKTAEGMIPVLQYPPHKRDDNKAEMYQYNHMVSGLPQRQIEDLLKKQKDSSPKEVESNSMTTALIGEVVMTMGMELRRAYINDLTVLRDGTLVSALDDGHIQLWKHGAQQNDVIHPGNGDGGVSSVVAWHDHLNLAFATAGRGAIQLWNDDAEEIARIHASPVPGATTPSSLVRLPLLSDSVLVVGLAARFCITRAPNPNQFRLPPQTLQERQRRAQAEAEERMLQETLDSVSKSVQVWYTISSSGNASNTAIQMKSQVLNGNSAAPITCLETIPVRENKENCSSCLLVAGDANGGLRIWKGQLNSQKNDIDFAEQSYSRLVVRQQSSTTRSCSIAFMKVLENGMIAVSTNITTNSQGVIDDDSNTAFLSIPTGLAVHVLDPTSNNLALVTTLDGHKDVVQAICELPNGDLLTGGGKFDATLQLWSNSQLHQTNNSDATTPLIITESTKTFSSKIGYVFCLQPLTDIKEHSTHFALAVARYNVLKIVV